jgi:hypothetical protein
MAANARKILLPGSIRQGFIQSITNKTVIYSLINANWLLIANRCGKLHAAFRGVFAK